MKRGNVVGMEERDEIWFPKLVFTNSIPEIQMDNDDTAVVTINREGLPIFKANNDLQENELFKGEENPIVLERYVDLNLRCNFEFSKYPFDQQLCNILVRLVNDEKLPF